MGTRVVKPQLHLWKPPAGLAKQYLFKILKSYFSKMKISTFFFSIVITFLSILIVGVVTDVKKICNRRITFGFTKNFLLFYTVIIKF